MDKILFLSVLFSSAASQAAEKAGMPQLNPDTWFSQIFWLVITFVFLYVVISKIVLPKLSESIEQRNDHVSDNIDAANHLKNQAEEKYQEYLKIIADAKKEAKEIIEKNKKDLQSDFENRKRDINEKSEQKIKEVENEILEFKKQAIKNIDEIAEQIAKNLVKTVSKIEVNDASAKAIVQEVSKKFTGGLN